MAGKTGKKSKEKGTKKRKGRGLSLLACLGGCGGKMPREDMMDEITQLDFRHQSLTQVPPDVFACECTLETLHLDSNQLTELPRELFYCHGLQTLTVSDNELKNLPTAMAELTALQSLDVSKNNLSGMPDSIKSCRELRVVDASVNPMGRLPEGFTQLIALKELFLNDTFLEYLPANFGRLVMLEVLELRENQLNTLPKSLARLTKLRRLDIGSNEFSQLPEVVGSLAGLTELWFDNNRVRSVAPFIGALSELTYLDGSNNRIDSLPEEISSCTKLTNLYLSDNHLKSLPSSLCQCSSLEVLQLDDNALGELPHDIGALSNLTELVLSKNDLESLPASIGLLRNLHTLHVDDNVLTSIPSEIGSCVKLSVLTLAANRLQALPPELGHASNLKVLNVWDNSIRNLPVAFSKLKLLALWLSDNQTKPSVQLQTETDPLTGQKVLTCYMLPQQPSDKREENWSKDKDEPFPMANWDEKHRARSIIKFAFDDMEAKGGSKLSRAPTPYPKELRALAKHARNLTGGGKNTDSKAEEGTGGSNKRSSRDDPSLNKRGSRSEDGTAATGEVKGRRELAVAATTSTANVISSSSGVNSSSSSNPAEQKPPKVELLLASDGSVTAEYHAAAATVMKSGEFSMQPVVKTANKTSPDSVVVGSVSGYQVPASPSKDKGEQEGGDDGMVAPPVEEGPPEMKEARTVLQSEASPSKMLVNSLASDKPALEQQQHLQRHIATDHTKPTSNSTNTTEDKIAGGSSGSPKKQPVRAMNSDDSSSSFIPVSAAADSANTTSSVALSEDETPADLLAEALAVADDVAGNNRTTMLEDPADRSSTDSGYCRPSHNTNSLNDISDQSCDLVSPVSSLPPETPTSPPNKNNSAVNQNTFTYSSPKHSPLTPHQTPSTTSPLISPNRINALGSSFAQQGYPVPPADATDSERQFSASSSPGHQPRPGSLALASLAESGVLSDRAGYINRPGSFAAPCNTVGVPPAPPSRAMSAATGLNHASLSPASSAARQAFSPSRGTDSPSLLARPGETAAVGGNKSFNGGLYTIQQHSPTSPTSPVLNSTYTLPPASPNQSYDSPHNLSNSSIQETRSNNSSSNYTHTSATSKYSSSQSRIPMNKQLSSSSIGDQSTHSNGSSRIPPYSSQLSNKLQSGDSGSKLPSYTSADSGSRIPSLSSTGRSYSNLSNKSLPQDQYRNYSNATPTNGNESFESRESGIKMPSSGSYKHTAPKDSGIAYSGQNTKFNNGMKPQSQIPGAGSIRNSSIKNSSVPNTNGTGLQAPSKVSALPSPSYNTGIPTTKKSFGIPAPSYSRSNSSLSNSDKEQTSRIPSINSSFGKSNITTSNNGPSPPSNLSKQTSSRLPSYSPNTSFESSKEHGNTRTSAVSTPHSRPSYNSGLVYKGSVNPSQPPVNHQSLAPVNQAINTPGLPPLPVNNEPRRSSVSQLQQPKPVSIPSSRIPNYGGNTASPGTPAAGAVAPNRPQQQQAPRQPNTWMFGSHQNARVFPVVIEKNPGPGFEIAITPQPDMCVLVTSVVANGPASSALKVGDKILQLDGQAITDVDQPTFDSLAALDDDTFTLLVSRLHS